MPAPSSQQNCRQSIPNTASTSTTPTIGEDNGRVDQLALVQETLQNGATPTMIAGIAMINAQMQAQAAYPEVLLTPRSHSQPSSLHTPLVHIPNPETVATFVNYKQPTAIKTARLHPHSFIVHIPDTEYSPLPSLRLPSDLNSSNTSKIYPPLKPIRKQTTSLSNLLDTSSEYNPQSQDTTRSYFIPQLR